MAGIGDIQEKDIEQRFGLHLIETADGYTEAQVAGTEPRSTIAEDQAIITEEPARPITTVKGLQAIKLYAEDVRCLQVPAEVVKGVVTEIATGG